MERIFRTLGFTVAAMLGCGLINSQLCAQSTFVYVNNNIAGLNSISAFSADSSGNLTALQGSPYQTGGVGTGFDGTSVSPFYASNGITATAAGNFLFAADTGTNDITAWSINPSTGALMLTYRFPYGTQESVLNLHGISLAVTPNGQYLYAANADSQDIWVFSISSTGALTQVGSPFPLPGGAPDGIKVTPDGKYLAVALPAADGDGGISGSLGGVGMFSIGSNGALTGVTGWPFSTGGQNDAAYVDINCASNLLFASQGSLNTAAQVNVLTIANGGALNSPVQFAFDNPYYPSEALNSNVGVLSPNDQFLFVSNQYSNSIMALSVAAGGALSQVTGSPFCNSTGCNGAYIVPPLRSPLTMGTNQAGTVLYVANYNELSYGLYENTVSGFTIGSGGVLTQLSASPFNDPGLGTPGQTGYTCNPGCWPSVAVYPPKACVLPALTITAVPSSTSMTYGGTPPTITPSYSGFVNGDTVASLTSPAICSTTATSSSPVGTYPATCSGAVDASYTITYVAATVTVNPAPLTIAATPSSTSMTYGGTPPTITPTYSGFVNGDTVTSLSPGAICSTTATSSSPAGTYSSNCSGAGDPNYTFTYVSGTVTVNQAPLTITASSGTIVYGTVSNIIPSYMGFVNGDSPLSLTKLPTCTTTATMTSIDGTYPTSCYGALDPNYIISYVNGTLTVIGLELSSTSVNFGTVYYLDQIASRFLTVTNTLTTPIKISSINITAPGDALFDYGEITSCPPYILILPGTLGGGKSCVIDVGILASVKVFSPTASTATLTVNDSAAVQQVLLTAQVINPQAALSQYDLNFGTQTEYTSSGPITVTLSNPGNTPLNITNITISGNFALSPGTTCTPGGTVNPSSNCILNVAFAPESKGWLTGSVTITDNAFFNPQVILLSGTGK
jgi:6-phosphogluconolactonase (cycloisomerase 2 family)